MSTPKITVEKKRVAREDDDRWVVVIEMSGDLTYFPTQEQAEEYAADVRAFLHPPEKKSGLFELAKDLVRLNAEEYRGEF